MSIFFSKKIFLDEEELAENLRKARQEKKLKLEEVAKKLNINIKYLKALEKGAYNDLPEGIYGKNFLREYTIILGLNYNELLKQYNKERNLNKEKKINIFSNQVVKKWYFVSIPKIIKNLSIIIVVILCFFYLNYALKKIYSIPELNIISPQENFITNDNQVIISGQTEPEVKILINNEQVLIDSQGNFNKTISLNKGINEITITAEKKFGKINIIKRHIMVK